VAAALQHIGNHPNPLRQPLVNIIVLKFCKIIPNSFKKVVTATEAATGVGKDGGQARVGQQLPASTGDGLSRRCSQCEQAKSFDYQLSLTHRK
jgi:hypothetical protein